MIGSNYLLSALQSLLQPLQGSLSSGTVTARATGQTPVTVPAGLFGVPCVGSSSDDEASVFVKRNPATEDGSWVVTQSGAELPVESVQGGERTNIDSGTEVEWTEEIDGLYPFGTIADSVTGGANSEKLGALRKVIAYKDLGSRPDSASFFAAQLGEFPAAVFCWSATTPANSSSLYDVGPDNTRISRDGRLYVHQFDLMLVTARLSMASRRRREGDVIRDNVVQLIQDRWECRGLKLSSGPKGIQVADARLANLTDAAYVDVIRFGTMTAIHRLEERTFAPWITSHLQATRDTSAGPKLTVDDKQRVPQQSPPVATSNFRKLARGY